MDGFTLSIKPKKRVMKDYETYSEREGREEWRLATGQMNHHRFELDDWIPNSYLEMADDEFFYR